MEHNQLAVRPTRAAPMHERMGDATYETPPSRADGSVLHKRRHALRLARLTPVDFTVVATTFQVSPNIPR